MRNRESDMKTSIAQKRQGETIFVGAIQELPQDKLRGIRGVRELPLQYSAKKNANIIDKILRFFGSHCQRLSIILRLMLILFLTGFTTLGFARFGGGTGTKDNPWIIRTSEHLNNIRDFLGEEHSNKHYLQTADIDLGTAPYNVGQGWVPIGSSEESSFQGHYDGNGKIISNLTISRTQPNQALFGYVKDGTIVRLGLKDVNVFGSDAAGLVGRFAGNSLLQQCFVTGTISGTGKYIGGLISMTTDGELSIVDCYSVTDVSFVGTLSGSFHLGGLVGFHTHTGTITRCIAVGSIRTGKTVERNFSPLIGANWGRNLYWNIDTAGIIRVETLFSIQDFKFGYGTAELLRQETFEGFDFDEVWRIDEGLSYPYFKWEGTKAKEHNLPPPLPPLILSADGSESVVTLTWKPPNADMGTPDSYNIYRDNRKLDIGPVTELKFVDRDVTDWTNYSYIVKAVYGERESISSNIVNVTPLRRLTAAVKEARLRVIFDKGSGTEEDPYQISGAEQLNNLRNFLHYHYIQTADIDLSAVRWTRREGWQPIGDETNPFTGYYDGNGHVIKGLKINRDSFNQGLFGVTNGANLKNISLTDADIKGTSRTGTLLGRGNNTTITDCNATGKVSRYSHGADAMGGLVGDLNGSITGSGAEVDVYSPRGMRVGGLVGNARTIKMERCFAAGNVTGRRYVGGLAGGRSTGLSNKLYATGDVKGEDVVGGLFGFLYSSRCSDSYATANVVGNDRVGGLVGTYAFAALVRNTYAAGKVTGETNTGGFIGFVDYKGTSVRPGSTVLRPQAYQPYNSYWDTETTGQAEALGGEGAKTAGQHPLVTPLIFDDPAWGEPRTTRQMTSPHDDTTYLWWDFHNAWKKDTTKKINNGYPYLRFEYPDEPDVASDFGADYQQYQHNRIIKVNNESLLKLLTFSGYKYPFIGIIIGILVSLVLYYLLFKIKFLAGVILLVLNSFLPVYLFFQPEPPFILIYASTVTLLIGLFICWFIYEKTLCKLS